MTDLNMLQKIVERIVKTIYDLAKAFLATKLIIPMTVINFGKNSLKSEFKL